MVEVFKSTANSNFIELTICRVFSDPVTYCCRPHTMWRDFEGGVYWDELVEICNDILRVAEFRGAARFQGNTVCMVHCCMSVPCCTYFVCVATATCTTNNIADEVISLK